MSRSPPRRPASVALPPRTRTTLERYRRRVWVVKIAEGALSAIFGLAVSYLVVFSLDRWFDTPALLRAGCLGAGSVGMVVLFPLKCHNWVWRLRRLDQAARLLRRVVPRFGDHLLGIVELARSGSQPGSSRALIEAAMRQVDAEIEHRDLSDAVPDPRHRRWAWAAGLPLALAVAVMIVVPAAGGNALARWLTPWRDTARYTFAQLEGDANALVVAFAEPFDVTARLRDESPWRPASATARYEDQAPVVATRDGMTYRFRVPPQRSPGRLSLRVGDARRAVPVEPRMRPALEKLVARLRLPDYLQRSGPLVEDARGGTIRVVEGSSAVFLATATRDLAAATLDGRPQRVDGPRLTTERIPVEGSTELRLEWTDRFGLSAREPQVLRLEALGDEPPTVRIDQLPGERVVISRDVLTFEVRAGDDHGVRRVGLEWEGIRDPLHNPEPSRGEKLVAAGGPNSDTLTAPSTFSAERESVRPQSLRLRAFAEDYLPGRERVHSPAVVIHVLTPAEHFRWVTEQISQWASAARDVYDEELRLHQANEQLRALPAEALDDPAERKRIRDQAAAESANAARLEGVVDAGRRLVREAARNEEFRAEQLEAWADTIAQLEAIAGERMPSVADLLARAAQAPGQPKEGEPGHQPTRPTPLVADTEPGFHPGEEAEDAPRSRGGLLTPSTRLQGSGRQGEKEEQEESVPTTAELVDEAVTEQRDLLDAFAELADEMSELLMGFEESTFVKRLKAASRRQIDIAVQLDGLDGFGLETGTVADRADRERLAGLEVAASDALLTIQEDMDAYADRRPSESYSRVLEEMRVDAVVEEVRGLASAIEGNRIGQSTIDAEFWADALDRWAEQLVAPLPPRTPPSPGRTQLPSLPPRAILEVMRIIDREIRLREETRELDRAREAMVDEAYRERGRELSDTQAALAGRSRELARSIELLPDAEKLGKEIEKLTEAAGVMDEATSLLATPATGPATIAAIAEVIEILLETRRAPNAPTVVKASPATESALMLIGLGDDGSLASIERRSVEQSTGSSGRRLPEEYRQGLDAYFDVLEGTASDSRSTR